MRLLMSLRSVGSRAGSRGISLLLRLGLLSPGGVTKPALGRNRVLGLVPYLVGGALGGMAGSTMITGFHIGAGSTAAFNEGRLGEFAGASPQHIVQVVEDDWFAESVHSGLHDPSLPNVIGDIWTTYSPAARTFAVDVWSAGTKVLSAELICAGTRVDVPVVDAMRAIVQRPPWPCSALVLATQNADLPAAVSLISLDGTAIAFARPTSSPRRATRDGTPKSVESCEIRNGR